MENNYFIPNMEDIRVGYELEHKFPDGWKPIKVDVDSRLEAWNDYIQEKRLRVPYLTKEQIEAEGWEITFREFKPSPYKVDWINARKGDYNLWINLAMHDSMHLGIDKTKWGILYRGQCKDINTFRQIIKLVIK